MAFQENKEVILWKLHFRSSPQSVYRALTRPEERKKYWADSVEEDNGILTYNFKNLGLVSQGKILEAVPNQKFSVIYLNSEVTFKIDSDGGTGTDMSLEVRKFADHERVELIAGWVNWLLTMKAAVDFGIDLRNHDPKRTWVQGYAEN